MKKRIIRISDISQIDTTKISVYDLNNRYVDQLGNMYGLKYNRIAKKVEIIKIERILTSEVQLLQRKILQPKDNDHQLIDNDSKDENEYDLFNPEIFINNVVSQAETHRERLNGIMMNIDSSDIFLTENKMEITAFADLSRHIELDCIQQLEKLEAYYKELVNYPRTITYYQAKIDNEGKNILDYLINKKENSMKFVFVYEMATTIKRVYGNIKKHMKAVEEFIIDKNPDDILNVSKFQKQAFLDAKTSITNTITEVDEILKKQQMLYEFAINKKNFSK